MQTETVIVQPAELEQEVDATLAAFRDARTETDKAEQTAATWRETLARRRYELGRALTRMRSTWPPSGPKAKGWSDFLARKEIDHDVALDAMAYYSRVSGGSSGTPGDVPEDLPTLADAGIDKRPRAGDGMQEQPELDQQGAGSAPRDPMVVDRNTWCTPRAITEALGKVDLDPCANDRSHVQAGVVFRLDRGEDGLERAPTIGTSWRVFINPPYGKDPDTRKSLVSPWVTAYKHTRFIFLLRFDPSTDWFHELWAVTERVLFLKERIEFEPPPGVAEPNSNPYPHALFFARGEDVPTALLEQCFDCLINRARS